MISLKRNGKVKEKSKTEAVSRLKFFVENLCDLSLTYTINICFQDGVKRFFALDSEIVNGGTELSFSIDDRIFKGSEIFGANIKASNASGLVFKSENLIFTADTYISLLE